MFLSSTDKKFAVINPARMCQPLGAVQALLGVKGAMPLIHGSQGCSTYMRFQLCRHFREPINISSTSMSESTVVYGGEKNLIKALDTITRQYEPELIGVTSSCLTETIGDDMDLIIRNFLKDNNDFPVIPISTPSYAGSHVEGYNHALRALVEKLVNPTSVHYSEEKSTFESSYIDNKLNNLRRDPKYVNKNYNVKINLITGLISPSDVFTIKDLLQEMELESIILTDTSQSLHSPLNGEINFLPSQGTTIAQIKDTINSRGTICLSRHADSAGVFLEKNFGVKLINIPLPVGLSATDQFVETLSAVGNKEIPENIKLERGQLLDAMVDAHAYNYKRRVAIYGEPDMVIGLTRFLSELGMHPVVVCTGTQSNIFRDEIGVMALEYGHDIHIISGGDLYDLQQKIVEEDVELLLGNSYSARIASEKNIPLIRVGFPVFDRIGAQRINITGYRAGLNFLDKVTNTIMERYYDPGIQEKI
ncbi:MAG: nitrogenase [Euryarchaeota archaeon]|nr:nitrogenase [Euryarchaeota archaeon]MBU4607521.1 nitrogenase [Euryarchaeota archaeon]MBV1729688.1 nitrogenase [Methanobacterium sp.]MBV1754437.1 nitrogenase [Methanobacterium sp.]